MKTPYMQGQAVLDQIERRIEEHGWAVINAVFDRGVLAYTVGLEETLGHPEIVIAGLEPHSATALADIAAAWIRERGPVPLDRPVHGLATAPVVFKAIPQRVAGQTLRVATQRRSDSRAVQMVWPDRSGRMPWHDDFDAQLRPHVWAIHE